jgi:4-amino-4-deoxy-L-arabinose transferase-like glycosyltransferase
MKSARLLFACAIWLAARLIYNGLRQLVPDEAYYWVWSRHLSAGYLDHPPMVAWLIAAGTHLFGTSEFGVRAGAAILTLGSILLTVALVRQICPDRRAARLAGWILLLIPMTAALGMIVTPDTPACFFSLAALFFAVKALSHPRWWLVFGICTGAALMSKYTAVLLPASVGLALLSSSAGRRCLRAPWPWLGVLLALLIFLPVVRWNQMHGWVSFRFQLSHGASEDASSPIWNLAIYIGGQLGIYSPVLLILGIATLARGWKRFRQLPPAEHILLFAATFPLVFFCAFALRHRPEANWPIFAYFPMTALLAPSFLPSQSSVLSPRLDLSLRPALIVAISMTILLHVPETIELIPNRIMPNLPNPWDQMFGWREYGAELDKLSGDGASASPVFCTTYEYASEASFYMTGRPEVWTVDTNRPTAFDYFAGRPAEQSLARAICVTRAGETNQVPEAMQGFPSITFVTWQTTALRRVVRRRFFLICRRSISSP